MSELVHTDPSGCPDEEMLAAWSDGGLRPEERARIETHAAGCSRCQAHLLAMVQTDAATGAPAPVRRGFRLWPWLVPITSTAAALGLWFLVEPLRKPDTPQPPAALAVQAEDKAAPPPPAAERSAAAAAAAEEGVGARRELDRKRENRQRYMARPVAPPAPAAESPPPASVAQTEQSSATANRLAESIAITGLNVRRAPDGQVSWDRESPGLEGQITAASSPSPSVIWLVGRGGLVLLSLDGQTWTRRGIPVAIDLTAVRATDAASAVVTAADGRNFATSNGGLTWARQ
jgi:Putative zinc-finger